MKTLPPLPPWPVAGAAPTHSPVMLPPLPSPPTIPDEAPARGPTLSESGPDPLLLLLLFGRLGVFGLSLFAWLRFYLARSLGGDLDTVLFWFGNAFLADHLGLLLTLALLVELPIWLENGSRNLATFGIKTRHDHRELLRGFVIPPRNIAFSYRATQEIWAASRSHRQQRAGPRTSPLITGAWLSWLMMAALLVARFVWSWLPATEFFDLEFDPFDVYLSLGFGLQVMTVLGCILTLGVVFQIDSGQRGIWQTLVEARRAQRLPVLEARAPSQAFGPRHGIQLVLAAISASIVGQGLYAAFGRESAPMWLEQACLLAALVIFALSPAARWRPPSSRVRIRFLGVAALLGAGWFCTFEGLVTYPLRGAWELVLERIQSALPADEPASVLLQYTLVILVAPIVEELVFRGFLLDAFRARWHPAPAVLASALLFVFVHWNPVQMMSVFTLGTLCGIVRIVGGSIWPSVILHATYNALLSQSFLVPTETFGLLSIPVGLIAVAFGIAAAIHFGGSIRSSEKGVLTDPYWWWGEDAEKGFAAARRIDEVGRKSAVVAARGAAVAARGAVLAGQVGMKGTVLAGRVSRWAAVRGWAGGERAFDWLASRPERMLETLRTQPTRSLLRVLYATLVANAFVLVYFTVWNLVVNYAPIDWHNGFLLATFLTNCLVPTYLVPFALNSVGFVLLATWIGAADLRAQNIPIRIGLARRFGRGLSRLLTSPRSVLLRLLSKGHIRSVAFSSPRQVVRTRRRIELIYLWQFFSMVLLAAIFVAAGLRQPELAILLWKGHLTIFRIIAIWSIYRLVGIVRAIDDGLGRLDAPGSPGEAPPGHEYSKEAS